MSVSAAIRELLAKGFTVEQALAAAEVFEASAQPVRSKRQDRNARYYEANKEALLAEKRLKASEPTETSYSSEPSEIEPDAGIESPQTPKINKLPSQKATPSSAPKPKSVDPKAEPIGSSWEPTDRDFEIIGAGGLDRFYAERAVPAFRVYWQGRFEENPRDPKAKKKTWNRTFQNYCLMNIAKLSRDGPIPGGGGSRAGPTPPSQFKNQHLASAVRDRQKSDDHQSPRDNIVQHPNAAPSGRREAPPVLDLVPEATLFDRTLPVGRRYAER